MGVGSQRAGLEYAESAASFRVRELAPDFPAAIDRALRNVLTSTMAANGQAHQADSQELLTTTEVAQKLRCSRRHARRIAARLGTRHGHQWLVPADRLKD